MRDATAHQKDSRILENDSTVYEFKNGKLESINGFKRIWINGSYTPYEKSKEMLFQNGVPHGDWFENRDTGSTLTGSYLEGKRNGTWRKFEDGQIVFNLNFINGDLHGDQIEITGKAGWTGNFERKTYTYKNGGLLSIKTYYSTEFDSPQWENLNVLPPDSGECLVFSTIEYYSWTKNESSYLDYRMLDAKSRNTDEYIIKPQNGRWLSTTEYISSAETPFKVDSMFWKDFGVLYPNEYGKDLSDFDSIYFRTPL